MFKYELFQNDNGEWLIWENVTPKHVRSLGIFPDVNTALKELISKLRVGIVLKELEWCREDKGQGIVYNTRFMDRIYTICPDVNNTLYTSWDVETYSDLDEAKNSLKDHIKTTINEYLENVGVETEV